MNVPSAEVLYLFSSTFPRQLTEWFGQLEHRANIEEMAKILSIKILEFFRGMAGADEAVRKHGLSDTEFGTSPLATHKSQAASPAMAEVQPIGADDAQRWVNYWISKQFL